MADNPAHRAPRDRLRTHVLDVRDLRALCDEFGVAPHQVKSATLQAGVMVVDARAYPEQVAWHRPTKEQTPAKPR